MMYRKSNCEIKISNEFIENANISEAYKSNLLPSTLISPIYIMWDITYRCPFKCLFCYNNSGLNNSKIEELTHLDLLNVADEIIECEVINVCLCGGEPFSRLNDFVTIAKKLNQGGIIVNCVTNGWYLTEGIFKQLEGVLKVIQVSLDGPNAITHDFLRGKVGAFEKAVKAIQLISGSALTSCEITFVPTKVNYHLFDKVVDIAIQLGGIKKIRTQHLIHTGRAHDLSIALNEKERGEFEEIFIKAYEKFGDKIQMVFGDPWAHIHELQNAKIPPLFLQITGEGLIKISPYIPLVVGDLRNESFIKIWKRVNDNRNLIAEFLNKYKSMNFYSDGIIPWIHKDIKFIEQLS